jgi:capsular exopolysaccharide synthesis family protein
MEAPAPSAPTFGASITRSKTNGRNHAAIFDAEEPGAPQREAGQLDDHLVSLLEPTGFAAEQYRTVRLAIENFRRERGLHVVAISSPGRREGKTISAINLAGALAQSPDARVALVDADLRHPRVAGYLGIPASRGLSGFLLDGSLTVDHVIEKPSSIAFSVVPAGAVSSMPYELLKSPRLAALFGALRTRFDYIVVDTPPVLGVPDVGILRDAVDGFVLVVRAQRTPREGLIDGLDTIGRHRVLGLVFNDDPRNAVQVSDGDTDSGWRKYFSFRLGGGLVD